MLTAETDRQTKLYYNFLRIITFYSKSGDGELYQGLNIRQSFLKMSMAGSYLELKAEYQNLNPRWSLLRSKFAVHLTTSLKSIQKESQGHNSRVGHIKVIISKQESISDHYYTSLTLSSSIKFQFKTSFYISRD